MRITIEPTAQMISVDGVLMRIWQGTTERGIKCRLAVSTIAAEDSQDQTEFQTDLAPLGSGPAWMTAMVQR